MQLKTYSAASMAQALAEVKKDLGKDAVILHTRVYRVGAVMGLGGRQVVEITASDQAAARSAREPARAANREPSRAANLEVPCEAVRPARPLTTLAASDYSGGHGVAVAPPPVAMEQFQPAVFQRRRGSLPPDAPIVETRATDPGTITPKRVRPTLPATPVTPTTTDPTGVAQLRDELASIKRLVGEVLQTSRRQHAAPLCLTDPMRDLAGALHASGLPEALGDATLEVVRDDLSADERADPAVVRQAAVRALAKRLPTIGMVTRAEPATGRPLTIALVGPTGVGKTTTVAKLAAVYKLRHGKRVGLVTADTYRIAAVDQLRTYATILGIPLRVALTPQEMRESLAAMRDCEVVLVDSAGRSPNDTVRLSELSAFIEAAAPSQTHLVLSAGADVGVLRRAVERFTSLLPDRLLLTKLDEAVRFGAVAGLVADIGLPVHYVTAGQEVPDHIELASSENLARLVIDPDESRPI